MLRADGVGQIAHNSMMHMYTKQSYGFTLIETAVTLFISAFVLSALLFFFSGSLTSYRSQISGILATASARNQIARITDTIRNAQDNGTEPWLQVAQDNTLTVWTNRGGDAALDKVTYSRSATDNTVLVQTIESDPSPTPTIVLRGIDPAVSVFEYFDSNGNSLSTPESRTPEAVQRVGVRLLVAAGIPGNEESRTVSTDVTPRQNLKGTIDQLYGPDSTREAIIALPTGTPPSPTSTNATITIQNPISGQVIATKTISIADLNDGRVTVYANNYYAMINYKSSTGVGNPPGWYVWMKPSFFETMTIYPISVAALYTMHCLAPNWEAVQDPALCEVLPLNLYHVPAAEAFQPILTYNEDGYRTYIRDIVFTLP